MTADNGESLSRACAGQAHMQCLDWHSCGCACHQVCGACGSECRTTYESIFGGPWYGHSQPGAFYVCASCYRAEIKSAMPGTGTRCEGCSEARKTYRDPRSGDEYLCSDCHKAAGHRTQEGGEWE